MSWHPVRKIIAVGWTNGELLTWNEHDKDLHEVFSIHKSRINTVKWSHNGHRLVTGDQVRAVNFKSEFPLVYLRVCIGFTSTCFQICS